MSVNIPKPSAGPVNRFLVRAVSENNPENFLWASLGTFVVGGLITAIVGLVMGIDDPGKVTPVHWNLVFIGAAIAVVATLVILACCYAAGRNSVVYDSYRSSCSLSSRACNVYWKLDESNREVARSAVEWILKHESVCDSKGNPMYTAPCQQRLKALDSLLAEQAATENALAMVNSDDVRSIEEYTKSLADIRQNYTNLIGH